MGYAVSSTSVDTDAERSTSAARSAAGTVPNDADSDDDGLTDGDEVLVHGTKPLDADSDDDGLTDGDEVHVHGTNPNKADTDGDGLADGEDVEFVQHAIESVPASYFNSTGAGSQDAVLAILETVEASLLNGHEAVALQQLSNLHSRVDGCGWAADNNDWITDCAAQLTIRSLIELLTTNITT